MGWGRGTGHGDPDPLSAQDWGVPGIGPLLVPLASHLTTQSLSPQGQVEAFQLAPLGPAPKGPRLLHSPSKGTGGRRPPLSDETPAQGSLSLMKGSLCGEGRPLAKDKTAVCPPSRAHRAGASPRTGWWSGGGHRCAPPSLSPPSPLFSVTELLCLLGPLWSLPQPGASSPSQPGAPSPGQFCCWQGSSEFSGPGGIHADAGVRARDAGEGPCIEGSQHPRVLCASAREWWLAHSKDKGAEAQEGHRTVSMAEHSVQLEPCSLTGLPASHGSRWCLSTGDAMRAGPEAVSGPHDHCAAPSSHCHRRP